MTWFDGGDKLPEDKRTYKEHLHGEKVPGQRAAPGRREGLVLLRERLRRRAHPAAEGQVQGRREAQADPAALAGPLHRMGRTPSRPTIPTRRCRTSTTPAGSPRPCSWASSRSRPAPTIEWDPVGHEGQERPVRRPVHPPRLSQGLLDPRLTESQSRRVPDAIERRRCVPTLSASVPRHGLLASAGVSRSRPRRPRRRRPSRGTPGLKVDRVLDECTLPSAKRALTLPGW